MTGLKWSSAWSASDGAGRAVDRFVAAFGGRPDGVWSAPGRVNVIGEHTDYAGGLCLPVALPHRTFLALRPRTDGVVRLVSSQEQPWTGALADVVPGRSFGWAGYVLGAAWALARTGVDVPGFDAAVESCVPFGAGLSSSAALECAAAVALDEVTGSGLAADDAGRARLAAVCVTGENQIAGAPTGGMDQAAALLCRAGHALLLDFRDGGRRHVAANLGELALLVVDTRAPHRLVDGQYAARRTACEAATRLLGVDSLRDVDDLPAALAHIAAVAGPDATMIGRRVRHVVTENARVTDVVGLLEAGRPAEVGPVLTAGHASLRDDYEVSSPELDLAVRAATDAGAIGARMVGGGFGGSVLALVRRLEHRDVARGVTEAFGRAEFARPAFLLAEPSGPADQAIVTKEQI